jgi:hypothetical protein
VKLTLFPVVIFGVALCSHVEMSRQTFLWLSGTSVVAMAYVWLCSFAARTVLLFEDRVAISQPGSRSRRKIYYSDVHVLEISPNENGFQINLRLKSGKLVTIFSPDKTGVDQLNELFKPAQDAMPVTLPPTAAQ